MTEWLDFYAFVTTRNSLKVCQCSKIGQARHAFMQNWFRCSLTLTIFENQGYGLYKRRLNLLKAETFDLLSMLEESIIIL